MIVVLFSVPHESRDFRRTLRDSRPLGLAGALEGELGCAGVVVAHVGIGAAAAEANARSLFARIRPRIVISTGYAGGLDPALRRGTILVARNFSSPELVVGGGVSGVLTTQSAAAETVAAKQALALATGASAVDMETAVIAAICQEHRLPLLAIRAISDAAGEPIPVPLEHSFDLARQRARPGALLLYLLRNPARILPFMRFVRGLSSVRRELSNFLVDWIRANAP